MPQRSLTDPGARLVLGESRGHVLNLLRAADGPVGVQDVAERTGLHPNTARFHLDGLVDAGLATRETEDRQRPGRPRTVYRATATDLPVGQRSYHLLAEMLTSLVADLPDAERAAITTGEAWGRYLADRPAPSQRVDVAEGIRRLTAVLADTGFAPDPDSGQDPDDPVVALRHCPFREIAEQHREVVCGLHLGLMRGVLAEIRAPLAADRLEPFVEPSLCLARLTPAPPRPARRGGNGHGTGSHRRARGAR